MSGVTIPTEWTPEEALSVAYFLESLMVAIWETHGDQMSRQLQVTLKQGCISAQLDDPHRPTTPTTPILTAPSSPTLAAPAFGA